MLSARSDVSIIALTYALEGGLRLVLNAADVGHCQSVPFIDRAEELAVELEEQLVVRLQRNNEI